MCFVLGLLKAQTVANFYLAFGKELPMIPVLNKIDLKHSNPEKVIDQLNSLFEIDPASVLKISAKNAIGIDDVLQAVVKRIPPPPGLCLFDYYHFISLGCDQ